MHCLRNLYDKPEELSFTPAGRAIFDRRKSGELSKFEPDANCLPQGVPKINATPVPFRMFQMKDRVVIVYEAFNLWRQVFLDGRKPVKEPNPTWLGYSTGKYDKDTLVVTTVGFDDRQWVDAYGYPVSEKAVLEERYSRPTRNRMRLDMTHDLIEQMVGHRTRLAQEWPARRDEFEDRALKDYLATSADMDRSILPFLAGVPSGWMMPSAHATISARNNVTDSATRIVKARTIFLESPLSVMR